MQSSIRDGRLKVEIRLSAELGKLADEETQRNHPVRIDIQGSDLTWSVKSYGEAGDKRTVALACYDIEALAPFQCVALHVGPGVVKLYGASFDGMAAGQQSRLEITQTDEAIRYSWSMTPPRGPDGAAGKADEQSGRVTTLGDLRRLHPTFIDETLTPALRRLGVRGFFRRHPAGEVYRAFPDVPADPKAAGKLAALLPRLGASKGSVREAASAELEALGRAGVAAILRVDRTALSPEQNTRLDLFLRSVGEPIGCDGGLSARSPAEVSRDVDFLLDCLDDDDAGVRAAAKAALEAAVRHPVEFDVTLTGDARAAAVDRLFERIDSERQK